MAHRPAREAPSVPVPRTAPLARRSARARRAGTVLLLAAILAALLASCSGGFGIAGPPPGIVTVGPDPGTSAGQRVLDGLEFRVERGSAEGADWAEGIGFAIDDERVVGRAVRITEDAVVLRPGRIEADDLPDGERTVTAIWVREGATSARTLAEWTILVDRVPPPLEVELPAPPIVAGEPVTISGRSETGALIEVVGLDASLIVDESGAFVLTVDAAPAGVLTVTATDVAGNVTTVEESVAVVPSRADVEDTRGLHVTACTWSSTERRAALLDLADRERVTAFVMTVKAEDGHVGFAWPPYEAIVDRGVLATTCRYDLPEVISELHGRGIQVVARIVAFRDPVVAAWAWESGERDMVIQTPDGEAYQGYGGFLNPADPDVREYNLALAEAVAAAGADMVLWDYIRRPDGPIERLVFPGLEGPIEAAVVEFTRLAEARLAPYGVQHGASVYGIAATRPLEIGQDIPAMARHLDVVAPMVYPSHWAPSEYGLTDPLRAPYDIVTRSVADHMAAVEGTGARVVPWLEDTRYRAWDRPRQVRDQLRATYDLGITEWMLWDPGNAYTPSAILAPSDA